MTAGSHSPSLYRALVAEGDPERRTGILIDFLRDRGEASYDEAVTQLAHALQTAALAERAGAQDAAVVGALLHDIGHLVLGEYEGEQGSAREDRAHEVVGARFLEAFFPAAVTDPIRYHVIAKRYLCTVDAQYHDGLSRASKRSLIVQGGPLSTPELEALEQQAYLPAAVEIRRWDDLGKDPDQTCPPLESYASRITAAWT